MVSAISGAVISNVTDGAGACREGKVKVGQSNITGLLVCADPAVNE